MPSITKTRAWQALKAHREEISRTTLRELFDADPGRYQTFSYETRGLALDLSKNRMTHRTLGLLAELAKAAGVEEQIEAMLSGQRINESEDRAARHMALRDRSELASAGVDAEVRSVDRRIEAFTNLVRAGRAVGATGKPFTDVLSIGIGGSHLGPMLVMTALRTAETTGPKVHYVDNIDGHQIASTLAKLDPATTLVLAASKSFTTMETLANAETARKWIVERLGRGAVAQHFVGLTSNTAEARAFGITDDRIFPMWDWVGGRFSVWSAVGLSAALGVGWDAFSAFRAGAHAMDRHFAAEPLEENLPVLLAMSGIWNNNFLTFDDVAIVPYDERLRALPSFLQQLEMESNGKRVRLDGSVVDTRTAPVVFGMVGTSAQHTFHQLLHQGTRSVPVDFIAAARPGHALSGRHDKLIANMLAQSEALAFGTDGGGDPHRTCPGNRPSTTILLEKLDPFHLGMLIALYEHKVFVQGVIWGINSFDQFGVELGKQLADPLVRDISASKVRGTYDSSTAGLLRRYRAWRGSDG